MYSRKKVEDNKYENIQTNGIKSLIKFRRKFYNDVNLLDVDSRTQIYKN